MAAPIEGLQRIGVTVFATDDASVEARQLVPVFHRWIQSGSLPGNLLIDVADYAHVPGGPGILLVGHEGNLTVSVGTAPIALTYTRKQPVGGALADRLRAVAATALTACRLLQDDVALRALRFRGDTLEVFANDRLRAPNTPEAYAALEPAVWALSRALYGDTRCELTREDDARERLRLRITASARIDAADLTARLAVA
jgi:hypothetical protein